MKKLDQARRWLLLGYLDLLEKPPNGYGALVHRAANKITGLRSCLRIGVDLDPAWENDIKDVIRGIYGEDQSYDEEDCDV